MKKFLLIIFCLAALVSVVILPISPSLHEANALAYTPGDETVVTQTLANTNGQGDWVRQLYKTCLGFFDVLLVIALLAVAFANILHINIEAYSVKKVLPMLIVGVFVAHLAIPIFTVASKIVDTLQGINLFHPTGLDFWYLTRGLSIQDIKETAVETLQKQPGRNIFSASGITSMISTVIGGSILAAGAGSLGCFFALLLWMAQIILLLLLHLMLDFRPYIVYLAAALSPIAVACAILPQTQTVFKKWLTIAAVWITLPLIVFAIINLGYKIPMGSYTAINTTNFTNTIDPSNRNAGTGGAIGIIITLLLPSLLRMGLVFLAFRYPFTVEKDISGGLAFLGKHVGQGALRLPGTMGALKKNPLIKDWLKKPENTGKYKFANRVKGFSELWSNPLWSRAGVRMISKGQGQKGLAGIARQIGGYVLSSAPAPTFLAYVPQLIDFTRKQGESDRSDVSFEDGHYGTWIDARTKSRFLTESNKPKFTELNAEELSESIDNGTANSDANKFTAAFVKNIEKLPSAPLASALREALIQSAAINLAGGDINNVDATHIAAAKTSVAATLAGMNPISKMSVTQAINDHKAAFGSSDDEMNKWMALSYGGYLASQSSHTRRGLDYANMDWGGGIGTGTADEAYGFLQKLTLLKQKSGQRFAPINVHWLLGLTSEEMMGLRKRTQKAASGPSGSIDDNEPPEGSTAGPSGPRGGIDPNAPSGDGLDGDFAGVDSFLGQIGPGGANTRGGQTEVTNLDEIGPAVAQALKEEIQISPEISSMGSERMLNQLSEQLAQQGVQPLQIEKMITTTREGQIKSSQQLLQFLPEKLAQRTLTGMKNAFGANRLATGGALMSQNAQSAANFVDQLVPRLAQISQVGGAGAVGQAASVIIKNEQHNQINMSAGKPVVSTVPPAQLAGYQKIIGKVLGIPENQVNENIARGAVQALELISARTKK